MRVANTRQLVSLRLDPELHERIKAAAADQNRSVNNYLATVLDAVVPVDEADAWIKEAGYQDFGVSTEPEQAAS